MTTIAKIAGVILSGGRSSRMGGGDKSLELIGGVAILARIIERLRPQVDYLAINANGDPARFEAFGLSIVPDSLPDFPGPLAGILAGMDHARGLPGYSHVLSVAGDTPFLPGDLVERLVDAKSPHSIAVASSCGRRHPVFALWPLALRDDLAHFLQSGNGKVSAFTDRHASRTIEFPMATIGDASIDPFFNVNTPEDLAEAQRILERPDV